MDKIQQLSNKITKISHAIDNNINNGMYRYVEVLLQVLEKNIDMLKQELNKEKQYESNRI